MSQCQQFELYAAERQVPTGACFASVTEIQDFVDGLRDTWWWQLYYPQVRRVEVYKRDGRSNCSVGWFDKTMNGGAIEMLEVHWNALVVLHELAHVLAEARHDSRSHDPAFARVYLELVALVMGPDAYQALYEAFESNGIQHDFDDERLGTGRRMPACTC